VLLPHTEPSVPFICPVNASRATQIDEAQNTQ